KKHSKKIVGLLLVLLFLFWRALPNPLFDSPTSVVLLDKDQQLLGAKIAEDGQWRFPHQAELPEKFIVAITEFEDRRFFYHPGIDPIGIGRALVQNIRNGRIVSGGSTLTMQVIRLSRFGQQRTFFEKLIEAILAIRIELAYSKSEILAFYAANAPFGGNVVGLDAAAWRYYGKKPHLLSWAEAATLAVLPNSPSLIHPNKNRSALLAKRNRLLNRLFESGQFDAMTLDLAKSEALPDAPIPLPRLAPHLLDKMAAKKVEDAKTTRYASTIDQYVQQQASLILSKHQVALRGNGIHNAAAIIQEVETGNVIAYVGNVVGAGASHGEQVDVIKAPRSTGSILKPFLMAAAIEEGLIFPNSLLSDVPTQMQGYKPENYHLSYDGVITAKRALIRSLNVPFVHLLQDYGLEKFHFQLQQLGLTTLQKPANHYGLTLILGGAEGKLSEITNAYAGMARTLNHYAQIDSRYYKDDFRRENYLSSKERISFNRQKDITKTAPVLTAAAIYQTFDAMQKVERPNSEGNWNQFESSQQIAWKTGTSIGFRDAWAVGVTPKYAIGVWVGNADGEGRPGLLGVKAAAPILFDLFDLLPSSEWFAPPYDDMMELPVCQKSGFRALDICEADTLLVTTSGIKVAACPHHRMLHLDKSATYRVNSDCENPSNMVHQPWFVLPPVEGYYYGFKHPDYTPLPDFHPDCVAMTNTQIQPMQFIYPKKVAKIYVPIDIDGHLSQTVFKVAHRHPATVIYWHLDDEYLGSTETFPGLGCNAIS
ncbi:MAG: penicillin-binding protein 1C, partial [Bacteroidota bacterium]